MEKHVVGVVVGKLAWQEWPVRAQIARVNGHDKNPPPQLIATGIITDVIAVAH